MPAALRDYEPARVVSLDLLRTSRRCTAPGPVARAAGRTEPHVAHAWTVLLRQSRLWGRGRTPAPCCTGRVEQQVRDALAAVEHQDWALLKQVLHPYLHWSEHGVTTRGRVKVLAHLAARPVLDPPASYELRDGQIYRWVGAD